MALSVLQKPKVTNNKGRHAFNPSLQRNWNQSAGMIVPCFCYYGYKGTKGTINRKVFTRSIRPVSPAFNGVTQHIDFFKVPVRYLYSAFNDWQVNISDVNSSLLLGHVSGGSALQLPDRLPCVDYVGLLPKIFPKSRWSSYPLSDAEKRKLQCTCFNDAVRLVDNLGIGRRVFHDFSTTSTPDTNVLSLLAPAAYQKIYFDRFRNTAYENNNPYAYNLDWCMDSPIVDTTDSASLNHLADMFTLRYVNYRNDFFHNSYPSLNFTLTIPNGRQWSLPSGVAAIGTGGASSIAATAIYPSTSQPVIRQTSGAQVTITPNNIRAVFALDKLTRCSAYTPKHVRDQFKAWFGVDPGEKVSHEVERIGSYVNSIRFGEVTSTAVGAGSQSQLGEIAGKGIGSAQLEKDLKFFCEEDCIIMGVQYIMPEAYYDSLGTDRMHACLVKEDFWNEFFDNLGLRPFYYSAISAGNSSQRNIILAYQPPYQDSKLGIDKNHGLFHLETNSYSVHTGSDADPDEVFSAGPLSSFTTHCNEMYGYQDHSAVPTPVAFDYKSFKVNPHDLDSIFSQSYGVDGSEYYDQFYGWMQIRFNIVNGMSVHGQPSL